MLNTIDKVIAMGLLKQAAERKITKHALDVMMRTPQRGASVDWLMVGERLENLIANTPLDDPAVPGTTSSPATPVASQSKPIINTDNKALVTSLLQQAWELREERLLENA